MTNILLPPFNKIVIPLVSRVGGFYKLTAIKADGTTRHLTDWFPNLITDFGLNNMGATASTFISVVHVGTGNAAPLVSDVALQNFTASTTSVTLTETGASPTAPYYGYRRQTWRFGLGAAAGNLSEVGISNQSASGGMFSRALILDGFGVPTTVTVLSDEYLDVSYELRCYAPDTTTSYIATISGVPYDCLTRPSRVTDPDHWVPLFSKVTFRQSFGNPLHTYYSGAIGAVTAAPSGTTANTFSGSALSYSNNSLHMDLQMTADLANGNVAGGIKSTFLSTSLGAYQTEFNPVIPKDNTKTLVLIYRCGWGRYTAGSP